MTALDLYHDLSVQGFSLSVNGDKLILSPANKLTYNLRAQIRQHKGELIALLAANDANRYAHLITCQQCEHLAANGYCKVITGVKPLPNAMHDCQSFEQVQEVRTPIANNPYTKGELAALLSKTEKPLFYHLVQCKACDVEAARYCPDGYAIGCAYDALLMVFEDATDKRDALITRMTKARLSGRSVY